MTLSSKRILFSHLFALLLIEAHRQGLEVAIDQVKRTDAEARVNARSGAGISNSLHRLGLAGDLLLYKDGEYISNSAAYKSLGLFWEGLHELARWGGRFRPRADGGHFSLEHNGVK